MAVVMAVSGSAAAAPEALLSKLTGGTSLSAQAATSSTAQIKVTGTNNYDYAYKVLTQLNKQRKAKGLSALTMDKSLLNTAMKRAAETSVYWDHDRPDNTSCFTAFNNSYATGENIAAGQDTPDFVMQCWTSSPGHYGNMMSSSYKSVGIGCFKAPNGVLYWVQCFSSSSASAVSKPANKTATHTVKIANSNLHINSVISGLKNKKVAANGTVTGSGAAKGSTFNIKPYQNDYCQSGYFGSQKITPVSGITFKSSNTNVISVSKTGVCTLKGNGTTYLAVYLNGKRVYLKRVKLTGVYTPFSQKTVSSLKSTSAAKSVKLTWNKVSDATGYHITRYNESTKKWTTVKYVTTNTVTISGLSSGKTYKFAVKPCKKSASGTTVYGKTVYITANTK